MISEFETNFQIFLECKIVMVEHAVLGGRSIDWENLEFLAFKDYWEHFGHT